MGCHKERSRDGVAAASTRDPDKAEMVRAPYNQACSMQPAFTRVRSKRYPFSYGTLFRVEQIRR